MIFFFYLIFKHKSYSDFRDHILYNTFIYYYSISNMNVEKYNLCRRYISLLTKITHGDRENHNLRSTKRL